MGDGCVGFGVVGGGVVSGSVILVGLFLFYWSTFISNPDPQHWTNVPQIYMNSHCVFYDDLIHRESKLLGDILNTPLQPTYDL